MRLTSKPLAVIIVVLMFGGIFASSALGWWNSGPVRKAAAYKGGRFAGQANPADIRGSYNFGDVEDNFGIPAGLLAQAFGVGSEDPGGVAVKDLEGLYLDRSKEVGTASVRLFVAFYLGLPFELSTDIYLPESAAAILRSRGLGAEQESYLESHVVPDLSTTAGQPASQAAPAEPHGQAGAQEQTIKGKTTFSDLLDWGLDRQTIEEVLGMPIPAALGLTVKDFCSQNGLEFGQIKPTLQAELDKGS
jgi:hypothetical protein